IKLAIDDQIARAMTDVHLQLASLFLGLLTALITATVYLVKANPLGKGLKLICMASLILASGSFLYIFLMGGAASIPFDSYIRPGPFTFKIDLPPQDSWLTWIRGAVMFVGLLLAAFSANE